MTASTTEPTADEKKTRSDNLRKAYGNANTRLREAHNDEFQALYKEEAAKLGIDYKPKPTKAEKARDALRALLAENPDLEQELIEKIEGQVKADA